MRRNFRYTFRILLILTFSFLITGEAYAQSHTAVIKGEVIASDDGKPLPSAVIRLLSADSLLVSGGVSDENGLFSLTVSKSGIYRIRVSFIGFRTWIKPVNLEKSLVDIDLGRIVVEKGVDLKELRVKEEALAVRVKGDTVEFDPSAFKTTSDANVESLIKKLPGMQVDNRGNIKAVGEKVVQVTVDGKDFFGNDPRIATQNLPADAIAKVQIIDERSDQAKSTGIDDGKRKKVINLVLKENKKEGWFGNSALAGGSENRYLGSISANRFSKDKQLNFLFGSNNVSQGFSSQDATSFSGSGSSSTVANATGGTSRSISGINVGNLSGLSQTTSGGVNYSNAFGKSIKFSGSYYVSQTSIQTLTEQHIQNIQSDAIYLSNATNNGAENINTHRLNAKITCTPDSLTTIFLIPTMSLGWAKNDILNVNQQEVATGQSLNYSNSHLSMNSFQPSINTTFSISRKLRDRKGTLSLFINANISNSSSRHTDRDTNYYYQTTSSSDYNRQGSTGTNNSVLSISSTVNRAINRSRNLSLFITNSAFFSSISNTNDFRQYDPLTSSYQIVVDTLNNQSLGTTEKYSSTVGLNKNTLKWNLVFSMALQYTWLKGDISNPLAADHVDKDYLNLLPQAVISYRPKNGKTWYFVTGESVNPPAFSNLFMLQINPNPLYITVGNPDLSQVKYFNSRIQYTCSDPKNNSFSNISLYYNTVIDQVAQSSNFDSHTGKTTTRFVNTNGNYDLYMVGSFGSSSKTIKNLKINTGFLAENNRYNNYINGVQNTTTGINGSFNITLSYAYKELLNLTINNATGYNTATNSVMSNIRTHYFSFEQGADLSYQPVTNWALRTVLSSNSYSNQNVVLLNVGIQHFFSSKRQFSAELWGFDLLNQNSEISRTTITDNQITDTRTNGVHQYFYLKLAYKVNKIGNKKRS